jgi:hypothetical protein
VVLAVLLMQHEMWRDETQAWLIARDSGSRADLWHNTRYDGHPMLWYLVLWVISRVFESPVAMQVAHWAIACGGAALLLFEAPFALWVRVAAVFTYFPLFEYGVISRNYALTVAGIWLTCAALARGKTPWAAVGGIAVAANASPMGVVALPALAAGVALTPRWGRRRWPALAVVAVGLALAVVASLPAADYERAGQWHFAYNVRLAAWVVRGFDMALLPVPQNVLGFWGSSAFFPSWPFGVEAAQRIVGLGGVVAAAAIGYVLWSVRTSRRAAAIWVLGLGATLALLYTRYSGTIRQFGFFWVLLVAVLWLAVAEEALPRRRAALLLAPTLLAGVLASVVAASWDSRAPFSGAKGAAKAILDWNVESLPIVGALDYATSPVAAFLPHGRLYFPAIQAESSFTIYAARRARQATLTDAAIVEEALRLDRGKGVVVVASHPLPASERERCRLFYQSPETVVPDEALLCYRCTAKR